MNQSAPSALTGSDPVHALADFAASITAESLPAAVDERARLHILDAIGVGLAARDTNFAQRTLAAMHRLGGDGPVPVLGTTRCLPARDAALVNGVLCHGLDFDDTHLDSVVHPTASLFPCVFSAAMLAGSTMGQMLGAYVAGLEVMTRLGTVVPGGFHHAGFHATSIVGVFGCAVAAGRLGGLSADELARAQGIALSMAAGSMEFLDDGAWNKRLHPGWAAQSGITAAALAKEGFVGISKPYAGRFGLYRAYLGEGAEGGDLGLATRGLGSRWELLRTAIKPYSACHFTHAYIDAALHLHRTGIDPAEIRAVRALVPDPIVPVVCEPAPQKQRPQNDYDARFSIQFLVASTLLKGRFTLAELEPDALADPKTLALADLVTHAPDPESAFPAAYSGEVIVELADGRTLRHREQINRGAAERPLTRDDIIGKFQDNVSPLIGAARASAIEAAVLELRHDASMAPLAAALSF